MEHALQELLPAITAVVMAVVTGLLSLLTAWLREKFKIEIEARHRQALHSALETGVGLVTDALMKKIGESPASVAVDDLASRVVAYTRSSVPDSIRQLLPSSEQLIAMATAKLNAKAAQLSASMGVERPTLTPRQE